MNKQKKLIRIIREEILNEIETTNVVNDIDDAFDELANDFESADLSSDEVNEAPIALTLAGVALSLPEIMKLIGKFTNFISKISGIKKLSGDKLIQLGEKYHHKIIDGIEYALRKAGVSNTSAAKKYANIILHVIIAILLISGGYGAAQYAMKGKLSATMLKSALNAIKAKELRQFLVDMAGEVMSGG